MFLRNFDYIWFDPYILPFYTNISDFITFYTRKFFERNIISVADERGKTGMKSRNLVNRFSPADFCSAIISTAMKLNGLGSHKKKFSCSFQKT